MSKLFKTPILLCVFCQGLNAAEVSIAPTIGINIFYNDNIRLEIDRNANKVAGLGLDLTLNLERLEEISSLILSFKSRSTVHDESTYDSSDQFLDLNYTYAMERSRYNLGVDYTRDTTRTVEIENTGEVGNERRERLRLFASSSYSISERILLQTSLNFDWQDYNKNRFNLIGYENYRFSSTVYYSWNDRLRLIASPSYYIYEGDERAESVIYPVSQIVAGTTTLAYNNQSDGYDLMIGAEYTFSERLLATLTFGRSKRNSSIEPDSSSKDFCQSQRVVLNSISGRPSITCANEESSDNTSTFNFNLNWRNELSHLNASAGVEYSPVSRGTLSELHRLTVGYDRRLTEHLTLKAMAGYYDWNYDIDSLGYKNNFSTINKDFSFGLNYRISQSVSSDVIYSYYEREYGGNSAAERNRNLITFKLVYRPNKTIW